MVKTTFEKPSSLSDEQTNLLIEALEEKYNFHFQYTEEHIIINHEFQPDCQSDNLPLKFSLEEYLIGMFILGYEKAIDKNYTNVV